MEANFLIVSINDLIILRTHLFVNRFAQEKELCFFSF
jgi:hypothetical protein